MNVVITEDLSVFSSSQTLIVLRYLCLLLLQLAVIDSIVIEL